MQGFSQLSKEPPLAKQPLLAKQPPHPDLGLGGRLLEPGELDGRAGHLQERPYLGGEVSLLKALSTQSSLYPLKLCSEPFPTRGKCAVRSQKCFIRSDIY